MGFFGDSGGDSSSSTYIQTWAMAISIDSVDWACFMLEQEGLAGSALNEIARLENEELATIETFEELAKNSTIIAIIAANPIAMTAITNSTIAVDAIINKSTAMTIILANATARNILINNSTAMGAIAANSTAMGVVANTALMMQAIADSEIAMSVIASNPIALNEIAKSNNANRINGSVYNNLNFLNVVRVTCGNDTTKFIRKTVPAITTNSSVFVINSLSANSWTGISSGQAGIYCVKVLTRLSSLVTNTSVMRAYDYGGSLRLMFTNSNNIGSVTVNKVFFGTMGISYAYLTTAWTASSSSADGEAFLAN